MLVKEAYAYSLAKIKGREIETSSLTLLMESFLGYGHAYELFGHGEDEFPGFEEYDSLLTRLLEGEPVQYILGKSWFYGRSFFVDSNVLIPRMETEELVDLIIKDGSGKEKLVIGEIGTGSGIIPITLGKHLKTPKLYASDISEKALAVAKRNAEMHHVEIDFLVGDMLEPFLEGNIKLDILVSNPPYINKDDEIAEIVKKNEPMLALVPPSGDGLEFYRVMLGNARNILVPHGSIYLEIGANLMTGLEALLAITKDIDHEFFKDISGRYRILRIKFLA